MLRFEWDPEKDHANQEKQGVAFFEAKGVFGDPLARTRYDAKHSTSADPFIAFGYAEASGRLLVVRHTDRNDSIGLISARPPGFRS